MPGFSASIKERMLYSSCKNSVVEAIQKVASTYTYINWGGGVCNTCTSYSLTLIPCAGVQNRGCQEAGGGQWLGADPRVPPLGAAPREEPEQAQVRQAGGAEPGGQEADQGAPQLEHQGYLAWPEDCSPIVYGINIYYITEAPSS